MPRMADDISGVATMRHCSVAWLILLLLWASATALVTSDEAKYRTLVDQLQSVNFLHAGTTAASDNITFFTQCNGFSEGYQHWTLITPRPYAYRVDPASEGSFLHAPEMGIRSAVPLGGLGTGSFELRGDGTFADWTIENQGTSLASDYFRNSKIPVKEEAVLGMFVEGYDGAVTLRLHPPSEIAGTGVEALTYSGAYPFSRLSPSSATTNATVYAYSPFKLYDSTASNIPAIAFSLVLTNPSPNKPTNVSFMLSLPLGGAKDTDRPLGAGPYGCGTRDICDPRNQTVSTIDSTTPAQCIEACDNEPDCVWWTHTGAGDPAIPPQLHEHRDCPGFVPNDMVNETFGSMRKTTHGLQECIDYCLTMPICDWAMFLYQRGGRFDAEDFCDPKSDEPGFGCCFPKMSCTYLKIHDRYNFTSWGKPKPAIPANRCSLFRLAPGVEMFVPPPNESFAGGPRSGIKGTWRHMASGVHHSRNHSYDTNLNASVQDPAAAVADFTLLSADVDVGDSAVHVTTASANSLKDLWNDFADDGKFSSASVSSGGAMHGAISASATLAPGETRALTIVFSWYLPHRSYVGQDLGNFYATHIRDSLDAARSVSTRLEEVVADAVAWNQLATDNSYPRDFADFVSNSLATQVKMAVWVAKDSAANATLPRGRFRQFEAFSNCDLDPVHVSSYHMLPYATFWPDLAQNTLLTGWAVQQLPNGMIQETLGAMESNRYLTLEPSRAKWTSQQAAG